MIEMLLGIKLNDWELIGAPFILIIGKSEAENNSLTLKSKQVSGEKVTVSFDELLKSSKANLKIYICLFASHIAE